MSGCSSGYIPFSLAASPFLKVVGNTMFVEWKIKENMATLYFHSHIANHDEASSINGIKPYWEFRHEIFLCLLWKNTAGLFKKVQFTYSWSFFFLSSWSKFQSYPWKWHLSPLRTMAINMKSFTALFSSPKFSYSSFQFKGKLPLSWFSFFFYSLKWISLCFWVKPSAIFSYDYPVFT